MYIVKRGMLQVVNEDGSKIFATLSEGAVFGGGFSNECSVCSAK